MRWTNDADLVRQGLCGEREALGLLVSRYDRSAYSLAAGLVGNRDDALEIVQAAILKALQALPRLAEPERFGSWFLRIVRNTALDRSEQRARRRTAPLEEEGPGSSPGPLEALLGSEQVEGLRTALRHLTPDQKEVVGLRYGETLDYATIAERLGIPTTTVRSRLYEARLVLKAHLREDEDESRRR